MINFNDMNISVATKKALTDMGFFEATPIQEQVIPHILQGKDVIAQAPTGTGKTCAFGIPVVEMVDTDSIFVQALILCPTRELVIQTQAELNEVAKYYDDLKIVSIYGGQNIDRQLAALRKKPQIVVGTTGRVMDHLRRRTLKLNNLKILVLDEMDEMLNMGFKEDIDIILQTAPKERQTVLFSATIPKEILAISTNYQIEPISIKTQHQDSDIPSINQYFVVVKEAQKVEALVSLMKEKNYNLALVFCNTKKRVDELSEHINSLGINAAALHGDLRQHTRDKTMKKFKDGETQMLIATDVAARGIDVDGIDVIFNFDIPHDVEYYVHRIGRTARANKQGHAYTFASEKQLYAIKNFERHTKSVILRVTPQKQQIEFEIDKKPLDKALKILKKEDLSAYKDFILANTTAEPLDIAAALLLQLNQGKNEVALSSAPKLSMKPSNKTKATKYFINMGTRDDCDARSLTNFISTTASIPLYEIFEVSCLENFSFAKVAPEYDHAMDALNGLKFNRRILSVEIASNDKPKKDKPKSDKPKKEFAKNGKAAGKGKKEFAQKSKAKPKQKTKAKIKK